jgi:hypothetical protein
VLLRNFEGIDLAAIRQIACKPDSGIPTIDGEIIYVSSASMLPYGKARN